MPPCTPPERFAARARAAVRAGHERVVVLDAGHARAREAAADLEALATPAARAARAPARPRACRTPARRGPAGTPRATHSTTPPSESPRARAASMRSIISRGGRRVRAAHGVRLDLPRASPLARRPWPRSRARCRTQATHLDARRRRAAACARSRRRRRGRSSRARWRGRRPASCGCRTSPRWCSRRATAGRCPCMRLVGLGARVLVAHQQRDRRAERPALEDARRGSPRGRPPGAAW